MVLHILHETMVSPMSHGSKAIVPQVNPNLIKEQTQGNLINRNFVFGEGKEGGRLSHQKILSTSTFKNSLKLWFSLFGCHGLPQIPLGQPL
jgi:hypothetical protein